ncbi:MAG: hypothetical protein A2402_01260 [Candidatus Staskawiczbacteria bacterium RIFOXYC1_FULL_37_43]|nr:MAG: hypothetical protein A2813_02755 [Candidatus Staskawiczbacteria bacterium RIFCSPHIGHO2_01_FULL_37_17]OGZ71688.1 MAG: hypothetical protein A2891_00050 [Candidatus Staskawiczbacteria bacterium RIFCSPLOWO2_01_FULL_37_19]OGZ75382.1 MAG: hypothetical protein A2205_01400 [Candidatus Staskawiczbacteria bacterium RIFOXYA1_FULL_37_15]OGZ78010.1 MAG: hypothetical protein A2280_00280 [Candidatus Staskawiczbacteria bacterium RIFOXYA12_FULL_37_10]OGZ82587.1 MAG: hypothetical protein A2402_01260 [Can
MLKLSKLFNIINFLKNMSEIPRQTQDNKIENPLESKEVIAGVNIPEAEPQTSEITPPLKEPAPFPVKNFEAEKSPEDDKSLAEAKETLKKIWIPEDIKERKDLLEENKPAPAPERKLKIEENVGRRKSEEELDENKRMQEEWQKEKDIKEKQKRGETLSTSDFAFIKGIENRRDIARKEIKQKDEVDLEKPGIKELESMQIDTENVERIAPEISAETEEIKKGVETKDERASEEKAKSAEEMRQKQIEYAKTELKAQFEVINEAREKRDRAREHSFLKEAEGSFEVAEGRALMEEASTRAKQEAKKENLVVISRAEYEKRNVGKLEMQAEQTERLNILNSRWEHLSEKERAQYTDQNDFNKKAVEAIEAKIKELGENGISLSHSAVYAMMEKGIMPENIQILKGWRKFWNGGEIALSQKSFFPGKKSEKSEVKYVSKDAFVKAAEELQKEFLAPIKKRAEATMQKIVENGQRMWREKKYKFAREIIGETVEKYKKEEQGEIRSEQKEQQNMNKEAMAEREPEPEITGDAKKDTRTVWQYLREHGQKVSLRGVKQVYEDSLREYEKHGFVGLALEIAASLQEGKALKAKKSSSRAKSRGK